MLAREDWVKLFGEVAEFPRRLDRNSQLYLACAVIPLSCVVVYMLAAVLRFVAIGLTPISMLSPLYMIVRVFNKNQKTKVVLATLYSVMCIGACIPYCISALAYLVVEALPLLFTGPTFLLTVCPAFALVWVSLGALAWYQRLYMSEKQD